MHRRAPPAVVLGGSPDEIEARFYEALLAADLDRLMALWADDDEIVCVHPGGERLVGAPAIRAGFAAIFANGGISVQPVQVRRMQHLGSALHHLVERIEVSRAGETRTAWVLATNYYVKSALGWRLAAHHASPAAPQEPTGTLADAPATLH
jgi:uncharacterized protein (TIGR02246 family)